MLKEVVRKLPGKLERVFRYAFPRRLVYSEEASSLLKGKAGLEMGGRAGALVKLDYFPYTSGPLVSRIATSVRIRYGDPPSSKGQPSTITSGTR